MTVDRQLSGAPGSLGRRVAGIMLLAVLVSGCDLTGQYEANFKKAIQQSAARAVFDLNLHPTPAEGLDPTGEVKLRIPKAFDNASKWLKVDDPRAKIPFVTLPGLAAVLERGLDDESQQFIGTYLYFAATPKKVQKAEALQNALATQIAAAFPGAKWEDVQFSKPDGGSISLRRLRVEGQQPFYNMTKKAAAKTDGRFDLFYLDSGGRHVLIAWRVPKGPGQKYQLEPAIEASMGTLEAAPAADAGEKAN